MYIPNGCTQARSDPRPANVPPRIQPHLPQQYEFRQPPEPIQPLPQQGVDHPGEQAPDMMHQIPGHAPQQHVRGGSPRVRALPLRAQYDEGMCRENDEIDKNIAEKLLIQHEHEKIEALMAAQQQAAHHPEQGRHFHPDHEMAHQQHHGHRQGYSVDDPRYAPVQHQDGVGPSGHSSLPTSSFTAPQLEGDRPRPHPHLSPSDPYYVPGIAQCGDLAIPHHMHELQHPNEVHPQVVASQQQLENMLYQKRIERQNILQAQERMRAQQQMLHMEAQNAHGQNVLQPVQGYPQDYQGYQHMEDYRQMPIGHPQMQPRMVVPAQHPNEVDPQVVAAQQRLENIRFQKQIEQQQAQDQNHESVIHAQIATVATDSTTSEWESGPPALSANLLYDPDLTCPKCNKRFRVGEIQKYRSHVWMNCEL